MFPVMGRRRDSMTQTANTKFGDQEQSAEGAGTPRTPLPGEATARNRAGGRLRFWVRALVGTIGALVLVLGFGLWIVTRSWFIAARVAPVLERKLGGEVSIGRASYRGGSAFRLEDLQVRVPGMSGPAADLATVRQLDVKLSLRDLVRGSVSLSDVVIDGLFIRLSEDADHQNSFNVMRLKPATEKPDGKKFIPPKVRISQATLEYGSNTGAVFKSFGQRRVSGEMYPSQSADGWFNYELGEIDGVGVGLGGRGIFIKGRWNPITYAHESRVDGFQLDEKTYQSSPQIVREWWDLMQLEGKLDGVAMTFVPGQPFMVEFAVEDVGMTLPISQENLWARYQNGQVVPTASQPRMQVKSGVIRVSRNSIVLDQLTGELISSDPELKMAAVPYKITLSIRDLPDIDWDEREAWMQRVLKTAPFSLKFEMMDFSLQASDPGATPAIDLPVLVAKVLAKFSMTNWVLSSSVDVVRSAPVVLDSGELVAAKPITTGQAYIHKASGKYQKFPYQLDDVDAYMQFDNEKVTVHYLDGKGSGEGRIRISGEIRPPDNDASVSLKLIGTNMQLDDRFRAALKDSELKAFDMLFNVPAADAMRDAGHLPTPESIESAKQRQQDIAGEIEQLKLADDPGDEAARAVERRLLHAESAGLQRSIAAGPFELGGVVNVDLMIERAQGPRQPSTTSGTITVQRAGAVFEKFPYPMRAVGGVIKWQHDKVVLQPDAEGNGLPFITPGGGIGHISGEIDFAKRDGNRKVRPNLTITVADDSMNDSILAAIPLTRSESRRLSPHERWPGVWSKTSQVIGGLGLDGLFQYDGKVTTNANDRIEWDFNVRLEQGRARPESSLADALGQTDEVWPTGIVLDRFRGAVNINQDEATWNDVTAVAGETSLSTTGHFDFRSGVDDDFVEVAVTKVPLQPFVLNAISREQRADSEQWWERLDPAGVFDAVVRYEKSSEIQTDTRLSITPVSFELTLGGQRHAFVHRGGAMVFDRQGAVFNQLEVESVAEDRRPDGSIIIDGRHLWSDDGEGSEISGEWQGGRFESPLVAEAIRSFASEATQEKFQALQPSGLFNAIFTIGRNGGGDGSAFHYRFDMQPRSLAMHLNDTPVVADILQGSVVIEPDRITLDGLHGRHVGGEFQVGGSVSMKPPISADLLIAYQGRARSNQLEAFLPRVAREAMDSLKLQDGESTILRDGRLQLVQPESGTSEPAGWRTAFAGTVITEGASFVAGVPFTEVKGEFDLNVHHVPGEPLRLTMDCQLDHAKVMGQSLTNMTAPLRLNDAGDEAIISPIRADVERGAMSGEARFGIGGNKGYSTSLELAGVPLGRFISDPLEMDDPAEGATNQSDHSMDGLVYASVSISGQHDDPTSRRGRAKIRVLDGSMARIPLVMQAVQLLQLTLPFTANLDFADADMYLVGDRIVFERLLFESTVGNNATMQLFGEGEMNFETLELNLRFRSRSGIALIREIVGGVSDRLFAIEVTGTLRKPISRIVPLPTGKP